MFQDSLPIVGEGVVKGGYVLEYLREIYLDLNATPATISVKAKQGDAVHRKLAINLLKDGQPVVPSDVAKYQFRLRKNDGNAVILESDGTVEPIVANEGVVTVTLSEQCLVIEGRSLCDLALLDASGNALSTATFYLDIMPMPDIGSVIESSTEWQRLMEAIKIAEAYQKVLALRVQDGHFQYTTDSKTWVTFEDTITEAQIIALF